MKKILFTILLLTFIKSYSQKNNWVISAEIGINNSTEKDITDSANNNETKQKLLATSGRLGYLFKSSNIEIGIASAYSSSTSNNSSFFNNNDQQLKDITIQYGAYLRKYITINDKFSFQILSEYRKSKSYLEGADENNEIDIQSHQIVLRPGFVYYLTKKIALNANIISIGYQTTTDKSFFGNDTKTNRFFLFTDTSNISFGVNFYL